MTCHEADFVRGHIERDYIVQETCWDCHITSTWNFEEHDKLYFPIYSGTHKGRWSTCSAECHTTDQDYSQFTCGLNGICHAHDKDRMDRRHRGKVGGYEYESNHCYNCHPRGTEGD